jgi:hypothetical protein
MSFAAVFDFALSLIHSRAKQPKRTEIRHASLLQDNPNEEFQRKAWEAFLQNIKSQVVSPVGGKFLFISYAWDDPVDPSMQRWLTQLQKDLQMSGFEVFLDLSHMHDDMNARMLQGIERSAAALIICTPRLKKRASQKTSVAFELSTILSRKQDNGDSFQVLPLIYSGDFKSSVPDKFVKFLVRDCTDLTHYNAQLTDLANPLGIIPAILGVRKGGQSAYEPLLSSYRLACLSNLPAPNVDFTGRASLLDDLAEGFRRDQDTQVISHKPQAIRGLGGVGKTELALHYSHTHQASYDICRWIVSDGQHLSMSMRLFAEQAGIDVTGLDYDNDVVGKLYDYLSDHSWLLVFDNVEDAAAVRGYLPPAGVLKPNQHVLITSRSQAWAKVLTVDEFSESEAMAYINAHIDTQDQASIQALAIALGGLPLALSQAIAYMRATGVTVSLYLELLRANPVDALSEVDQDLSRSYPHTVWSTWALSREKIGQDPMAERMLHACAWMAADNIPLYLFEDEDEGVDKSVVFRALKTLRAYSMVDVTKDGFIKIHRLVQAVLQDSMRGDDSCLVRVIEYMSNAYPWHKQTQSDFDRTRDLLEHLDVVLKHAYTHQTAQVTVSTADWTKLFLQVSAQLSDAYGAFGDDTKRSELLEQALRISQAHYGPDHVEVAKTLINLGNAYGALGAAANLSGPCLSWRPTMTLRTWRLPGYWAILEMLMVLLAMLKSNARCRREPFASWRPSMAMIMWRLLGHWAVLAMLTVLLVIRRSNATYWSKPFASWRPSMAMHMWRWLGHWAVLATLMALLVMLRSNASCWSRPFLSLRPTLGLTTFWWHSLWTVLAMLMELLVMLRSNARCRSGPCIPLRPTMAPTTFLWLGHLTVLAMLMVLLAMRRSNARCRSKHCGFRRPTMALTTWRWLAHWAVLEMLMVLLAMRLSNVKCRSGLCASWRPTMTPNTWRLLGYWAVLAMLTELLVILKSNARCRREPFASWRPTMALLTWR